MAAFLPGQKTYYVIDTPGHREYIPEPLSKIVWADINKLAVSIKKN